MSDYRRGLDWWLDYWALTDRNYRAIANSHTLQFNTARNKSSQSAASSVVAWWRIRIMSSASVLMFLPAGYCLTTNSLSVWVSELLYDWRLTTNQFVWAPGPWDPWPEIFFQLNSCGNNPYITSSLTRWWMYLVNMLCFSSSVHFAHITCYRKFLLTHYTQVLCQYGLYIADHVWISYLLLQRQLSHLNGCKLDHLQV
jgi:hypothetical protein